MFIRYLPQFLLSFFFLSSSSYAHNFEQLFNTGIHFYNQGNVESAAHNFDQALTLDPLNISILSNCAMTHRKLNNLDLSIALYEKILTLHPHNGDAAFGLAQAYLANGTIDKGWQHFNKWRTKEVVQKYPQSITDIKGKTIIIRAEWGLGDMIQFIRYAQHLKDQGAYVIVEAPHFLINILSSCSWIDKIILGGSSLPQADYEIPLFCLPTLCKTTAQTIPASIPYLKADEQLVEKWKPIIAANKNFKVGICWDVGHHDTNIVAWQRTAPLHHWLPLAAIDGISLYSLQRNPKIDQEIQQKLSLHIFENLDSDHGLPGPSTSFRINSENEKTGDSPAKPDNTLKNYPMAKTGAFMDTAAIMQHLDLVITVDTSVAHLAGALGIPVWVLLPYSPDYRWTLKGATTQWYPTMRLFRQPKPGNWDTVMQEVVQALKTITSKK